MTTLMEDVQKAMKRNSAVAFEEFHDEISTDENREYRRGFRAGVLFASLKLQTDIRSINDAATERCSD